jgi:hypothetical protein
VDQDVEKGSEKKRITEQDSHGKRPKKRKCADYNRAKPDEYHDPISMRLRPRWFIDRNKQQYHLILTMPTFFLC